MKKIFHPEDYGDIRYGDYDNSETINKCIEAASKVGGVVKFGHHHYGSIRIKKPLKLK